MLEIVELGTGAGIAAGRAQEEWLARRDDGLPDRRHGARLSLQVRHCISRYTSGQEKY